MRAACWQTAESDWIALQQDMISQFNVEHWWEICEKRGTDEWRQVRMMHEVDLNYFCSLNGKQLIRWWGRGVAFLFRHLFVLTDMIDFIPMQCLCVKCKAIPFLL